jgi:flagellar biosynthetic protein FliR
MLGFQAGYSYINTIDPSTQVDASILNVLLTVFGGLLFFTFDLHLHVIRALALSLASTPLGTFAAEPAAALRIVRLGASVFETAVRLALPIVALLLLLDLALTLLSYVNGRMQLLTLSFTVKILFALAGLWAVLPLAPRLFGEVGHQALEVVYALARP